MLLDKAKEIYGKLKLSFNDEETLNLYKEQKFKADVKIKKMEFNQRNKNDLII